MKKRFVIIRTYSAGVFAGKLFSKRGKEVTLGNCRRIWYWSGAASLSQLAVDGANNPSQCKFSVPVKLHTVLEAIEIIPCTAKAEKMIRTCPEWRA